MSTEQLEKFQDEVEIPEGVTITQKKHMLTFVGPLGKAHQSIVKTKYFDNFTKQELIDIKIYGKNTKKALDIDKIN